MVKNLKRAKKLLEKEGRASDYDFFPQTYVLPLEHGIFVEEFRRHPGMCLLVYLLLSSACTEEAGFLLQPCAVLHDMRWCQQTKHFLQASLGS